jgi:hypothetical protein
MLNTVLIVDKEVYPKLDPRYIKFYSENKPEFDHVALVYVCKEKEIGNWKDDTWVKNDKTFHTIVLPYQDILKMSTEEVQAVMLSKALERLKA